MNISKSRTEFWNKFKKSGVLYVRTLLIVLGILGSLFVGHKFDANAEGNRSGNTPFLNIDIKPTKWVNVDNWREHRPFRVIGKACRDGVQPYSFNLNIEPSDEVEWRYDRLEYFNGYDYLTDVTFEVDGNYDLLYAVNDPSVGEWKYTRSVQLVEAGATSEGANFVVDPDFSNNVAFLAKKPGVTIKSINGEDITGKFDIDYSFPLSGSGRNVSYRPHYGFGHLKIKPKSDSGIASVSKDNFVLAKGGGQSGNFTYNPDDGSIDIEDYSSTDVEFTYGDVVYFSSATNSEENSPWKNEFFAQNYDLVPQTDLSAISGNVSVAGDFSKGAWRLMYDKNSMPEDSFNAEFKVASHDCYEFDSASVSVAGDQVSIVGEPYLSGGESNNKDLNFTIKVPKSSASQEIVNIGGQKYSQYTNVCKYADNNYKLTDLVSISIPYMGIYEYLVPDVDAGTLNDIWTVADRRYQHDDHTLSTQYLVAPKPGYAVDKSVTVKVNGVDLQRKDSADEPGFFVGDADASYPRGFVLITYAFPTQNNEVVLNSVKRRHDVKFVPEAGSSVRSDISINNSDSNWDNNVTADLPLDKKFTVELDLVNDLKIFKENAEDIKSAIIGANTDLSELECVRNGDKSVTLTIPHKTSTRTVTIPSNLLKWKTSNADFSIDFGFIDEIYKDEAGRSINLYKGNDNITEENLIALKAGNNSTLVNANTDTNVPYNELVYTLYLNDDSYVDLSDAGVSVVNGVEGEAQIVKKEENKLVFKLNTECEGASYRGNVRFRVSGLKSNLADVPVELCAKSILYLKRTDGTLLHLVTAPNDFGTQVITAVPKKAGADYLVVYPDYSKIFGVENIKDESIGVTNVSLENFNRVGFHIDALQEGAKVICSDPAETAPPIKFTPIEGIKYYNVDNSKTINFDSSIQGTINIPYGKEFSFAVMANEGFDDSTLELKANDETFSEDGAKGFKKERKDNYYVFTIYESEARYSITISGSIKPSQKRIVFNKNLGGNFGDCSYIYNGASVDNLVVLYGQGISFEVALPDKCNQSDIIVKFNDSLIPKINGRYTLNNITSDGTISVSNVTLNKYPITFVSNSRATYKTKDGGNLSGSVEVSQGDSFEFKVQPNAGYTMGSDSVVYLRYADGSTTTLKPVNDVYKISNVTQACTISVENVEDIVYTVKLVPADGVTYLNDVDNVIKDTAKVKHGRNFEFSVLLSDDYDDSFGGMNITVNDGKSAQSSAQKLASGRYVVPNVVEDLTIKVTNVKKNSYNVTLTGAEGIDYYDASGKVITGDNQVEDHADFSFKVELYPAYADSDITVMLGDAPMSADSNGFYTIPKVVESKTVTVVGIELSDASELVNKINNLPDTLKDLGDVDDVIEATKAYESLSDSQKALVGNADKLKALQEQVKEFHHVSNDVRVSGVDWYIKLYAIPITDDTDACGRIYKKLGSEYILSLYNVYLWNTLTDSRYTLPEGQSAIITLPTPDMTYFEKPTAINEKESGKIEFITPSIDSDYTTFQTDSLGPMGIVANRSSTPGRSSLLDAADANLDAISNFAASVFGNDTNKVTRSDSERADDDLSADSSGDGELEGNIDEKFRSRNNRVTTVSSALRLVLVLMILTLMALMIYFFIKRRKDTATENKE